MKNRSKLVIASLLVLSVAAEGWAKPPSRRANRQDWCGTHSSLLIEKIAMNSDLERRRARERLQALGGTATFGAQAGSGAKVKQVKDVAVIEDDGSLVSKPSPVDLDDYALQFKRKKKKIRVEASTAGVSSTVGDRVALGDDDSFEVNLPFKFKFYGKKYSKMFINSDGNLTFKAADSASTARDVARVVNGPPRIAPFFTDLNPANLSGQRGVFLDLSSARARITWFDVPEFGGSRSNTFQVTIYPSGRIVIAFGALNTLEAIVGVAPGGSSPLQLLDLTEDLPYGPDTAAILERFSTSQQVDDLGVAQAFLQNFKDDYDHIILWLDFRNQLGGGTFAYEFTIKNKIRGIGEPVYDASASAGSNGRLEAFVQMGTLARYSTDKNKQALATLTTLDLLGHEAGHRWLSFVRFRKDGRDSAELLGRDQAHWSFNYDTDASYLEGNDIEDNGDGSFTTVAATDQYSNVDRYLMGLIPAKDVGPFFYIGSPAGPDAASQPAIGETIRGNREDLTIEDIIAVEGQRKPAAADAPKNFKMAFVLLGRKGEPPSQASIDMVDTIRQQWEKSFKEATGDKGKVSTTLEAK